MKKAKQKPTPDQLQPLFHALYLLLQDAGGTLQLSPGQLWKRVQEVAPDEAKASKAWPQGKISLSMSIQTLKPVFAAAGVRVSRGVDANNGRLIRFKPVSDGANDGALRQETAPAEEVL